MPQLKARLMDGPAMDRALTRIAHEILERNGGCQDVCLVGIRRRGEPLARLIAEKIAAIEGKEVPVGLLDITLYRDDLSPASDSGMPRLNRTQVPFRSPASAWCWWTTCSSPGVPPAPLLTRCLAWVGPRRFNWRFWWIGATGSCPSGRISWAKTFPPPTPKWWRSKCLKSTGIPRWRFGRWNEESSMF